jgi:uncharacterized SAM-binding protein YcdF (DUF218 family)
MPEKRNNFSQLPSSSELQGILSAEASRKIPKGKEDIHYFEFSPLLKLAHHFDLEASSLTNDYSKEDIASTDLLEKGKEFVAAIREKILDKELREDDVKVLNDAYDYLAEEDNLDEADIVFIFGAKTPLRIEKAIDVYKRGYGKKLLISGKGPFYSEVDTKTEAEIYSDIAKEKGIPEEVILIESASITIPDNVRCSLNLLDKKSIQPESLILVNSPYTQRRGWAHFKKYTPDSIKFIRVNSETADKYKRDAWYKSPGGIDVVLSEYFKAKVAVSLNTA